MNASLTRRLLALSAAAATAIALPALANGSLLDSKRGTGDLGNTQKDARDPAIIVTHADNGGGGIGDGRLDDSKHIVGDFGDTQKSPRDPAGIGQAGSFEDAKRLVGDLGDTQKDPRDPADIETYSDNGGGGIGNGCHADVTRDKMVDWRDSLMVLQAWGDESTEAKSDAGDFGTEPSGDRLAADVNGDGTVGFEDLVAVLAAWGACN